LVKLRGRVTLFLSALTLVIASGMLGFYYIKTINGETVDIIDAFTWTVVTLTTLGSYTADTALETSLGKLFTSVFVILGISVFFIGAPLVLVPWVEKKVKNVLKPKPIPIPDKDHVVICGYSDIIDEVIDSLRVHGVDYVLIDNRRDMIDICREKQIPYVFGDPSDDNVLISSNFNSAISLIAAMDDEMNAFICLSADNMREDLRIIAIAEKTQNVKTLYASGANRVLNPKLIAGSILGRRACHDYVIEVSGKFAKFGDLEIRQYAIPADSLITNRSIRDLEIRSSTGAIIIGLWKEGKLLLNPDPDESLSEGTTILTMGTKSQLNSFHRLIGWL
jgi:Trk K+ transport system NAD-binding subunit